MAFERAGRLDVAFGIDRDHLHGLGNLPRREEPQQAPTFAVDARDHQRRLRRYRIRLEAVDPPRGNLHRPHGRRVRSGDGSQCRTQQVDRCRSGYVSRRMVYQFQRLAVELP